MSLPGSRRARPEPRQPSRTQRSHTPRASNSPALNRPEPLKRPPTTTAVIWLIGMLTLLTGSSFASQGTSLWAARYSCSVP